MPLDSEAIQHQQDLLASYRHNLAHLLQQAAQYGGEVYAPLPTANQLADSRAEVARINGMLRENGVTVEDEPNDSRPAARLLDPQAQLNRSRMLDKVESFWIKGVLDQSLYQIARIELGLEQVAEKVDNPWETIVQRGNQPPVALPPGKPIIELFDEFLGTLLILGMPGGGKTTILLELARDLIAHARQNEQHPIPVVFNLSSWATKRQPLTAWLAEELNQRYEVPKKLAQEWVDTNALVLLLDGLDEVAERHREACVTAINAFRTECGFVPVAICSRVEEYAALTQKLRMESAISIQPLTRLQVDKYLKGDGQPLAAVRAALRDDPSLWEILDSPLLVSITVLTYKDQFVTKLPPSEMPEARHYQLFNDYTVAMFAHLGRSKGMSLYAQKQTIYQLSWLAHQMMQRDQAIFYVERMQPDLLPLRQQWMPTQGIGLLIGLIFWFGGALVFGLLFGLRMGLAVGLVIGLIVGLGIGLIVGLGMGYSQHIKIVEALHWSWSRNQLLLWMSFWLGFGLVIGLGFDLFIGLGVGLIGGLTAGLSSDELISRARANQGMYRSRRYAFVSGLALGFICWLLFGLIFGVSGGLQFGVFFGFLIGLGCGLGGCIRFGGRTVLQHYTLRYLLYRNGYLPFRDLVLFLDSCVDHIFLRRVGGGYIFVHRLLMEHFASLYTDTEGQSDKTSTSQLPEAKP